jgi:hypothetical protein
VNTLPQCLALDSALTFALKLHTAIWKPNQHASLKAALRICFHVYASLDDSCYSASLHDSCCSAVCLCCFHIGNLCTLVHTCACGCLLYLLPLLSHPSLPCPLNLAYTYIYLHVRTCPRTRRWLFVCKL